MLHPVSRHGLTCINLPFIRFTLRVPRFVSSGTLGLYSLPITPKNIHVKKVGTLTLPRGVTLSDAQKKTIYALSTPPGRAGVGVIRVSGPDALTVWRAVVKPSKSLRDNTPEPWKLYRCRICHPEKEEVLDDGLAVFFKSPSSFTTEDVLELHIHSGRAIISSVLAALSSLPFCRPAEPGEFTRRAFEGGRLDLTQVEGLKDLIDAETESQRRMALDAARGAKRTQFEHLRTEIIQCLAMVEALIDFGEGEDIEEGVFEQARMRAIKLNGMIKGHLNDRRRGEIIRSGIRLAIFGPPNAGKSSLLNFLAQREAAIVTPVPGTTRDILELSLDIGGLPVIVADTAGVRATDDLVENIGIERARNIVEASDISLCVLSLPDILTVTSGRPSMHTPLTLKTLFKPDTCFLLNKSDLLATAVSENDIRQLLGNKAWVTSLSTGQGTSEFLKGLSEVLQDRYDLGDDNSSQTSLITHARHRTHLESASRFIDAFLEYSTQDVVLGAEELRYAAQAVGKISGLIDTEDVLDALFRDFCIGK
ncbi:tRNA modification GTPase TrmE [Dendrothele bispora CBS 962.96]|uniref:tRNA modification GTPase TrmE n=1 Tax=Dendrothele bispora (strain CBS 962.96) TaxID=1314807 RepID=A0A4S8KSJ5_DENBC|nr:tRNA modification GTPase TrmE [Dendrothele bispora CBS 962.96]